MCSMLQTPHGGTEHREGVAIIQLNPTPDPTPDVLHDSDQKVQEVQQRPRRINHLPAASTVQTCLRTCRAVVDKARRYECALDAVKVDVQMVVRQNVLKELNRPNAQRHEKQRSIPRRLECSHRDP